MSRPASAFGRFLARALDLTITVDLEVGAMGTASLSEVVDAVRQAIEVDPESFEELSGRSIPWWRETLAHASSVADVIRAFDESRTTSRRTS